MKITKILVLLIVIGITSCDVDYYEDPNEPVDTAPNTVFNHAVKETMDDLNSLFFGGGRFTQVTMQYWQQSEYGDEDRYAYRESMREYFEQFYYNLENFRRVIELNTDPDTKDEASAYGDNDAQIACARIMMTYLFNEMTNVWGPIPYWSYGGRDNDDFQALKLTGEEEIIYPAYVQEDVIHEDMLNELEEAYEQLEGNEGFTSGDRIY
ncbi:MAG: SusD/RagB family nutrient-binding outer membrane lipoprotein, partial [bacterium]